MLYELLRKQIKFKNVFSNVINNGNNRIRQRAKAYKLTHKSKFVTWKDYGNYV